MGSYRFMFAFATSLAIQSVTLLAVSALGDTAEAWRTVAIVYAIIGLIVNIIIFGLIFLDAFAKLCAVNY